MWDVSSCVGAFVCWWGRGMWEGCEVVSWCVGTFVGRKGRGGDNLDGINTINRIGRCAGREFGERGFASYRGGEGSATDLGR